MGLQRKTPMKRGNGLTRTEFKRKPPKPNEGTPNSSGLSRSGFKQGPSKPKPARAPKPVPGLEGGLDHQHSSGNPADAKLGPKPRKRMKQIGKGQRRWMVFRKDFAPVLLEQQGPECAWPECNREWTDVHHLIGRAGEAVPYKYDHTMMLGLCRGHNLAAETVAGPEAKMRFTFAQMVEAKKAAASARNLTVDDLPDSYTPPDLTGIT